MNAKGSAPLTGLEQWQEKEFSGLNPGLERIRAFLAGTGHPEKRFPAVHIAGTNGKGSTSRIISGILTGAGYRTGLYTSPHLCSIEERIRINGLPVRREYLDALALRYGPLARRHSVSFFEFITGLAFMIFARKSVDIAVIETGLGGRYDATNVIPAPLAAVITEIDYDHTGYLGDTIPEIAGEKTGIIKKGSVVICGAQRGSARKTVLEAARSLHAKVLMSGQDFSVENYASSRDGMGHHGTFHGPGMDIRYAIPLAGRHQAANTALGLAAIGALREKGYNISEPVIRKSLKNVDWPGRFSVYRRKRSEALLIADGAHNPSGMRALVNVLSEGVWRNRKITFITGILRDKAFSSMSRIIAGRASRVITVPVPSSRTLEPGRLAALIKKAAPGAEVLSASNLSDALLMSEKDPVTVICGSLYLVGGFYRNFKQAFTKRQERQP